MTKPRNYRLLLVDDNPVNLELLEKVIASHLPECQVLLANCGSQALELSLVHSLDGAFVDMQMPGMDGIEVCRRLKQNTLTAGMPVVLITAHQSTPELRAEGLNAGAYDFISQPIRNVELVARIKVLLRIREVEEQLQLSNLGLRKQVEQKTAALRWMTGLISAAGGESEHFSPDDLVRLENMLAVDSEMNFDGFRGEVFDRFPRSIRRTLISLSLLDEIPARLADTLTGTETVRDVMDYLERHNFFVSYVSVDDCYQLKGPLRQYLLSLVKSELNDADIQALYKTAADWWLEHRSPVKAVELMLRTGDGEDAEQLLRQSAPLMFGQGELANLLRSKDTILRLELQRYPWLFAALAVAKMDMHPRRGLQLLAKAGACLSEKQDLRGILFCACHQLKGHFIVDGDLQRQAELLRCAEQVWLSLAAECEVPLRIQAALFIALGHLQVGDGQQKADIYLETIQADRDLELSPIFHAWSTTIRSYELFVSGRWRSCFTELEKGWKLVCQTDAPVSILLADHLVRSQLLEVYGDESGRHELQVCLSGRLAEETYLQSLLPVVFQLQQIQSDVSSGGWRQAGDLLDGLETSSQFSDHIRSLILEQRAQVLTLAGRTAEALAAARESLRLRGGAGGHFLTRNALLMATVLYALGELDASREQLKLLINRSAAGDERVLVRLARWLLLKIDGPESVQGTGQLIGELLDDLKHLHLERIPLWFPLVHEQLLREATVTSSGPFIDLLAINHLGACLKQDGQLVPLLQVRVLGEFSLELVGRAALHKKDLSSSFRQLISMLLAAPEQQLSQEEIQGQLWPESNAERSRSKFDSLLLRLRKALEEPFAGQDVRSYLYLQKGMLCLACCRIDATDFEKLARQGIRHARRQEYWQADLAFRRACALWRGEFGLGVSLDDKSDFYRQDLLLLYLDATQRWAELLLMSRQLDAAVEVTRQALKYEPTHDQLTRLLYHGCQALDLVRQADQVLKDYAKALRQDGLGRDEITGVLEAIKGGVKRMP